MKKVIVFYDSAELLLARKIAGEIRAEGFTPWLADDDSKANWHDDLDEIVSSNLCAGAVVIWSNSSKSNLVVRDEAEDIVKANKSLLSLFLDGMSEAPRGLRGGPRHLLKIEPNGTVHSEFRQKLNAVFGESGPKERVLILNGKKLSAPGMVLSVSSFETRIKPDAMLSLLSQVNPAAVLV